MSSTTEQINTKEQVIATIDETFARISSEANVMKNKSIHFRWFHGVLTFLSIVGGVIAPALIIYEADIYWKLAAILVTIIVAASTSLKAAFKWGDRFGNTALSALSLEELASSLRLEKNKVLNITKEEAIYQSLDDLNKNASQKMYQIIKGNLEKEMAVVTQQGSESLQLTNTSQT